MQWYHTSKHYSRLIVHHFQGFLFLLPFTASFNVSITFTTSSSPALPWCQLFCLRCLQPNVLAALSRMTHLFEGHNNACMSKGITVSTNTNIIFQSCHHHRPLWFTLRPHPPLHLSLNHLLQSFVSISWLSFFSCQDLLLNAFFVSSLLLITQ